MSGITDPSEEYFKDGLWAWVSTAWKKLVADASSFLQINIAAQDIDVEVKQQTAADLTPGIMGWDGSAWRKLPMLWGYSDRWVESKSGSASGGGDATATATGVVAGYVYVLQALHVTHNAGVNKLLRAWVTDGASTVSLVDEPTATSGGRYTWAGELVLKEDDTVVGTASAPGDTKSVFLRVWGYKMKVGE